MEVIVAEYIRIVNENNIVVVDDTYVLPKLLCRLPFNVDTVLPPYPTQDTVPMSPVYGFQGGIAVKQSNSLRGLGFDYDNSDANVSMINKNLVCAYRTNSQGTVDVDARVVKHTNGTYILAVSTFSNTQYTTGEVCIYAFKLRLLPGSLGLHVFNETGEMIFDAMKGCMQNIGVLEGALSMGGNIARTYNIVTPAGLNANNVFITSRSAVPFYAAYDIKASGVSYASAAYLPRMTIVSGNVKVELVKQNSTGSNSSYSWGGYFENVIYVKQPQGIFL